jgi:hypothetical protein
VKKIETELWLPAQNFERKRGKELNPGPLGSIRSQVDQELGAAIGVGILELIQSL